MIVRDIEIIPLTTSRRQALVDLLAGENLPVRDLPEEPEHFFVAIRQGKVVGGIGLETYGSFGLLRSLVVHPDWRNQKIADALVLQLEELAVYLGLDSLFLLTETAPHYFERKGFAFITRNEVPEALKHSSEFSNVCPQSAMVMKKMLK